MKFVNNKSIRSYVGSVILFSQVFSLLAPLATFAAPVSVSGSDSKNALETVGTKANRLKTVGTSGVDESTGAFTYSYPLATPKGKFGLEPNLSINYNSQSNENSIVGYGQSIVVPYIERTSKYGTDQMYTNTNVFVSSLGGELILKPNTTTEYLQKFDDGSYQTYTFSNNIWTLTDRNGLKYTYGSDTGSRLSDSAGTKVAKWYLTKVTDLMGNKITYTYEKKNGFVYPKEIWYTIDKNGSFANKIVFERELRNDVEKSYKYGFLTTQDDRIKSIKAYTDNVLQAQFDLAYVTGHNNTRSLLSTIIETRKGTDGIMTTLPATTFTYQNEAVVSRSTNLNKPTGSYANFDWTGDGRQEGMELGLTNNLNYLIIDANGDYFPDLYNLSMTSGLAGNQDPVSKYRWNNKGAYQDMPLSTYNFPVTHTTSPYNNYAYMYTPISRILDANSDGLQDVLVFNSLGNSFSTPTGLYLNNGNGFTVNSNFVGGIDGVQYEDVNGDGMLDKIQSGTVGTTTGYFAYLNNGTSWNTTGEANWKVPVDFTINAANGVPFYVTNLLDINNDGLVDVVRSYNSVNPSNYGNIPANGSQNQVYLNTGNGWTLSTKVTLSNYVNNFSTNGSTATVNTSDISLVNTDGTLTAKQQDVLLNVTISIGAKIDVTYKGSTQNNSLGAVANPQLPMNIYVVDSVKETETKTGLIETTNYTFESGKMYADTTNNGANIRDRRFAGFKKVTTQKGNSKNIKYFHQGDGDDVTLFERGDSVYLIGKVFKEENYGTTGNFKYSETYRNYGVYNYNSQIYSYPKQEVTTTYDATGSSLTKAVVYDYDLQARLPKLVTNYGKVSFDIATNKITDLEGDTIVTKNIVSTTRPQKILSEETYDVNGGFLDKKMYFYDNLPFGYIEKGFLTESRNYSNANNFIKTNFVYNSLGLKQSEIDNNGNITSYTYDSYNNPLTVTNALGQVTNVNYNKVSGNLTYQKNPNGAETQTVYDGFGNAKSVSKTNPVTGTLILSQTENRVYNTNSITVTNNIYSGGSILKDTITTLDSFGRVVKVQEKTDSASGVSYKTTDYVYNNLGQLVSISYPYSNIFTSLGSGMQSVFTYDDVGRVVKQKLGDNESNIVYYVNGKKVYDNTVQTHSKTYLYNTFDKLISVTEKNNSVDQVTKYSWNLLGNLLNISDAENNIRNFTYDSEGRLLTQEDLHKLTDNTFGVYKYTYDSIGNLMTKKDPSGNTTTFTYDNLYRPVQEVGTDFNNIYSYDTCANGVGALCSVNSKDYIENIAYKVGGNILSSSKTVFDNTGNKTFIEGYTYNDLGQITSVTLPDSSTLNYQYNLIGKQKSVSLNRTINGTASTTTFVSDSQYNIDGTQNNLLYGNGSKTCYAYSVTNGANASGSVAPRLTGIYGFKNNQDCNNLGNYASSTNLLYAEDLSYNLFGQITGINEKYNGEVGNVNSTFTYDDLTRLTNTTRVDNGVSTNRSQTYSAVGNILSSGATNYQYSSTDYANPHAPTLIGTTAMKYDLNGNVLGDGNNLYEWNTKNKIKKQENTKSISEYSYDVSGERIKEKVFVKPSATSTLANAVATNTIFSVATQTSITPITYISEGAYNELKLNNLNSQGKVEALFAVAFAADYISKTCFGSNDPQCTKKESIKYVASYLYNKHNIKVSAQTLEEMYGVYIGNFKVPVGVNTYAKKELGILATVSGGCNIYQSAPNCPIVANLSTTTGKIYSAILTYNLSSWFGSFSPVDIVINNEKVVSSQTVNSAQTLDITDYIKKATTTALLNNFNVEIRGLFTSWAGMFASGGYVVKEMQYVNNNLNTGTTTLVTDNTLNTLVYGTYTQQDKNLLGAMYKEKPIASLFSNAKYLTIESFNELQTLGIGYSKLVIYDRLIDASFFPYQACDSLFVFSKDDCRKEIFVKHLYAIVKYETDKELSTYALDEIYDVVNGNLRMPNDITEYKLRDTKSYTINGNTPAVNYFYYNGPVMFNNSNGMSQTNSSCPFSHYYNNGHLYYTCDVKLPIPQEVLDRKTEIEKTEFGFTFSQGVLSNLGGTIQNYVAPTISIYPVVATTTLTFTGNPPVTTLYNWNTNLNYGIVSTSSLKLANTNYYDSTSLVKSFINGDINNLGLRFIGSGQYNQTNVSNLANYELRVGFVKDAEQNKRTYFTPLIQNPEDADIYARVLSILARVDKSYVGGLNISSETYNEIKFTDLATSSDNIKQIFQNNIQLQKDLTLSAVWNNIRVNKSVILSREALEELWMVGNDDLSVATDTSLYASTTYPFFNRSKLTNLSVVPGVKSTRELVDEYSFSKLFRVSTSSELELTSASITKKINIIPLVTNRPFTSTSTITQIEKDDTLVNIYANIFINKNKKLSREALEEIYYVWNNKEILVGDDTGTSTEKFDRTKLGTLEDLHYQGNIIGSKIDQSLDDNISYSTSTSQFAISPETLGELQLAGITSQSQLDSIYNNASSTWTKDAKLYYVYNAIKASTTKELSRESLEEIYLLKTNKVFWTTSTSTTNLTLTTGNITTNYYSNNTLTQTNTCGAIGNTSETLNCKATITIATLPGYNLVSARLIIPGEIANPSYNFLTLTLSLDGNIIPTKASTDITSYALASTTHTFTIYPSFAGYQYYFVNPGTPTIRAIYSPITNKFDRTTLNELSTVSSIADLKNSYDLITNATTTVLIEDSFIPLTSTTSTTTNPYQSATTLIATTTPTQTYQPPAVLAINNPYGYPYTYVNNIPVFILPNGTTSTDPLTRIYNTIAKNLNNLTIASTSASSSITYTKFYPTQNYEYDTRGVITINIPFNGKIVGTYKYDSSTSLGTSATPPEISFATLNHLGTPVILTDTSSNLTQKIKRDEWGTISTNSYDVNAVTNTSLGYTNQRQDADSNLTYIHQRYLSTQNKVWLSVDPVQYDSFNKDFFLLNPQSQNSYSYANMDPINNVDPDGRFIQAAVTVVARMIFATGIGSLLGSYAGDVTANYQNIADKKTTNTYSNLFKPRQDAVNGYGKDFWNNLQINTTSEIAKGSSEKVLTSKLGATGKLVTAGKNITSATAAGVTAYNIERSDGKSKSEAITKSLIVGGVSLLTGTTVSISKGIPAEAAGTAVKTGIFGTSVNPKFFIGAHAIREYQSEALEGYVEGVAGANVLYLERVNNE